MEKFYQDDDSYPSMSIALKSFICTGVGSDSLYRQLISLTARETDYLSIVCLFFLSSNDINYCS